MFQTVAELVLASSSPRRRQLLEDIGLSFTVRPAELDEAPREGEGPEEHVCRLALEKALAVVEKVPPQTWVLAADTVVVCAGEIMGKPVDAAEAGRMLRRLCGRRHEVWTGFCLRRQLDPEPFVRAVRTTVSFLDWSPELVSAYIASGEPFDKAGAYAIQGRGGLLVKEISGSCSNVIGLPMAEVVQALLQCGVITPLNDTSRLSAAGRFNRPD